jgi:hypothetical protein
MAGIAGDEGSAEWTSSRPASRGKVKAPWLAETLAKLDKKSKNQETSTHDTELVQSKKKLAKKSKVI